MRDLTNVFSGDKYISVSMTMLFIVQYLCDKAKAEDFTCLIIQAFDSTRAYMIKRYDGDTLSLLHLRTMFEPRYKA